MKSKIKEEFALLLNGSIRTLLGGGYRCRCLTWRMEYPRGWYGFQHVRSNYVINVIITSKNHNTNCEKANYGDTL